MQIEFSDELYKALLYARDEAMRTGSVVITPDHLLLGILRHEDNSACLLLREVGVDLREMKKFVDSCIFSEAGVPYSARDSIAVTRSAQNAINLAGFEALKSGTSKVLPVHLLLSLSRGDGTATAEFFRMRSLTTDSFYGKLEKHGWRRNATAVPPSEGESLRESIESQIRSLIVLSYPSEGREPN